MEKTPICIFFTFGSKINKFERKELEIMGKNTQNLKAKSIVPQCLFDVVKREIPLTICMWKPKATAKYTDHIFTSKCTLTYIFDKFSSLTG